MNEKIECTCLNCGNTFLCSAEYCFSSDPSKHLCHKCKEKYDKDLIEVKMLDDDFEIWKKTRKFK